MEDKIALERRMNDEIKFIANEFYDIIRDSKISDEITQSYNEKLSIDFKAKKIDLHARKLIQIIREIKERKITDDSYHENREKFEKDCSDAALEINNCLKECSTQLKELSEEAFSILQSASKFL